MTENNELNAFFESLSKTLLDAISKQDEEVSNESTPAESELTKRVEAIEKAILSDEEGSLRHLITELNNRLENTREALALTADNVQKLAGAMAVKKSIEPDEEVEKRDPEVIRKAAEDTLYRSVAALFKKPVGSKLILG